MTALRNAQWAPRRRARAKWLAFTGLLAIGASVLTAAVVPASASPAPPSILIAGQVLLPGSSLASASGGYVLSMQTDGNAVLYAPAGGALWSSKTFGHPGSVMVLQNDGNLVIYSPAGTPLWADYVFPGGGARLALQNDGNLVEYSATLTPVWSTNTWVRPTPPPVSGDTMSTGQAMYSGQALKSASGGYQLVMQPDGNLVAYASGFPIWSSNTFNHPGAVLVMQPDGNAVIYYGGTPIWASNTYGNPGARLCIQPDGNLVIYSATGSPLWATGIDWLSQINRYRAATGLGTVSLNQNWAAGLLSHFNYLANTPSSYLTGQYRSLHTENPASPYYTAAGALEAGRSDLLQGYGAAVDPVSAINTWFAAPFHAIGMLRARLTQVAFASGQGAAGLDVIGGLTGSSTSSPILFPGPGATTSLRTYSGNEAPNPLETCGWTQSANIGLPIIAMLPSAPQAGLSASVSGPNPVSSGNGSLCIVDQYTYRTTDSTYGPTGMSILQGDRAVLLIANRAYTTGTYWVTISQPGAADISWSFNVS